jgi:hypothetical protein
MVCDKIDRDPHEFRIATGKSIFADADVVFKSGAHGIGAAAQCPAHHLALVAADPGSSSGDVRNDSLQFGQLNVGQPFLDRHRVLDPHHELHVRGRAHQALVNQPLLAVDSRTGAMSQESMPPIRLAA